MATSESLSVSTAVRDGFSPSMVWNVANLFAIDGLMHIASNHGRTDTNIHKVTQIGGYCEGIPKGTVRVGINVGSCVGKKAADAYTGWNSLTRIMIEEVPQSQ